MSRLGSPTLQRHELETLLNSPNLVQLTKLTQKKITESHAKVLKMAQGDKAVYGINTGFGPLCQTKISPEDTQALQENLLLSHAVGTGRPIAKILSKHMLACKIHALAQGFSGIRLSVIDRMIYFLQNDLIPVVPEQGSVGASGDLAPLSHLFLPLIGEGFFWQEEEIIPAHQGLSDHGLTPLKLAPKEGLAMINGTQFILAHALVCLNEFEYLLDVADLIAAMAVEGFQGSAAPFDEALHALRPFQGNLIVAKRLRAFLKNSENMQAHANCDRVQDPYSLRCIPQVHGASRNAWQHLNELVTIELNSVTDNPVIISEDIAISGGNFHGQPLAIALDYLAVAAAELGNISDRRSYLLLNGLQGLPPMLSCNPGLNSGFMITQYTTAALVSENKSLCFPASADSIPTAMGQEDHVSMGSISGRKCLQIIENVRTILAIELLHAAQALEFRRPNRFSKPIEDNLALLRSHVPQLEADRLLKNDMDKVIVLIRDKFFNVSL